MLALSLDAQSLTTQLDSLLLALRQKTPTAHALLVVEKGEVVYEGVAGLADVGQGLAASPATNFRLASVAKQFTAGAILLLAEEGRLTLQQPLSDFLPELAPLASGVTIGHLLNHSAGLPDYEAFIPTDQTSQIADADVPKILLRADTTYFEPGKGWRYSNTGYCLLALVVEKASGQTFSQFIENELFAPLGMSNSRVYEAGKVVPERAYGYALDEKGRTRFSDQSLTSATKGDGGIYTSLLDFERWATLRQGVLGLRFEEQLMSGAAHIPSIGEGYYNLGWFFAKKPGQPLAMFHSGSTCGFSNMVLEVPEQQLLVVFMSNLADNNAAFAPICDALEQAGKLPAGLGIWQMYEQTR